MVAVQVVGKEPEAALQGHHLRAQGQRFDLPGREDAAGRDEALREAAVQGQIQPDPVEIPLVLRSRGRAEADGIAEIEGHQAGHHRIEVDHAQGLAGPAVQHDVVEFGVVMGHPQGQLAALPHPLQGSGFLLPGEDEIDLPLYPRSPAHGVGGQRLPEYAVAVRGVVKVGDGLMEGLGGEIRQHPLKAAEGDGALVQVLGALGDLQADAVLHIVVDTPGLARFVPDPVFAVPGGDQVQGLPRIGAAGGQKAGHRGHVAHQGGNVVERGAAEALQDIAPAAVRGHEIGQVDMSLAVAF